MSTSSHGTAARDWRNYPAALAKVVDRLRGVVIEHKDALEVMAQQDRADTLHYVDPPYLHETRSLMNGNCKKGYRFEMTDGDHVRLGTFLKSLQGAVVVSGYASKLYDEEIFPHWHRVECNALADGARKRVEVLWMNRKLEGLLL